MVNGTKMGVNYPLFWLFFQTKMGLNDNLEEDLPIQVLLVKDENSHVVYIFSKRGTMSVT